MRLVESYDDENVVTIVGRTFPAQCLVEDDDGIRIAVVNTLADVSLNLWAKAHSSGARMLVSPEPWVPDTWLAVTIETFMSERAEHHMRQSLGIEADLALSFSEFPSYRNLREAEAGAVEERMALKGFVHLHTHSEFCLAPETRVCTADLRWKPIGDVVVGEQLVGFGEDLRPPEGQQGNSRSKMNRTTVTHVNRVKRDCYRIVLEGGREIISSAEHGWVVSGTTRGSQVEPDGPECGLGTNSRRWLKTRDLAQSSSDHWASRKTRLPNLILWAEPWDGEVPVGLEREAGWLAGVADGEAWLSDGQISFGQNPGLVMDEMVRVCKTLGYPITEVRQQSSKGVCQTFRLRGYETALRFLAQCRPVRFEGRADEVWVDRRAGGRYSKPVPIISVEHIGMRDTVAITTTTKTFVAEGFLSHNSPLDGLSTIKEMVTTVTSVNQGALGITDHGICAAHPHLQIEAEKAGIKPIYGLEANFVEDRFRRGDDTIVGDGKKVLGDYSHLILWAQTNKGLRNIWAMSTEANRDGFYARSRMDWQTIERFSEGVLASTACLRGPVARRILADDEEGARAQLARLLGIFGDRLYVELHTNGLQEQRKVNEALVGLASDYSLPLVAVVDSHYPKVEDKSTHGVWIASQTSRDLKEGADLFAGDADYHLMSEAEVRGALAYLPPHVVDEAVGNTTAIAEKCSATIISEGTVPIFSKAETKEKATHRDVERLVDLALGNWKKKVLTGPKKFDVEVYEARFEQEMNLLLDKTFCGYYLMVSDYCRWARANGILVGPGRGSGSGSLVAFLCDITEIDPVETGLMFERFLTPGRTSLPDFDVDFPSSKRVPITNYVIEKYGVENVVRVGTHIRMKNKGVVRSLASVLKGTIDIHYPDIDAVSAIIEAAEADRAGLGMSWEELWDENGDVLAPYRAKYPMLFAYADKMVGRLSTYGKHPAGVVIAPDANLVESFPMRLAGDDLVIEFDMDVSEKLGLVKFDFLTLRTLDTIQMAVDLIREQKGDEVNVYDWVEQYEDPQVWDEISDGHTLGIFQIETPGGTRDTRRFRPQSLDELADVITLVRPGPKRSGLTEMYYRRKIGEEAVTYLDPRLEPILSNTYGAMIYQEQIINICRVLGAYSSEEADEIRRLLGKKKVEAVAHAGRKFISMCVDNGTDIDVANIIWAQMAEFSKYGFNRSHAYGYAILGYWCVAGPTRLYDWDKKQYVTIAKAYREGIQNIACYDEVTGQTISGKVAEVVRTGKKMGYVLRTKSNKRLEASEMHLILTDSGWKRMKDIRPGDRVASEMRVSVMSAERRQKIAEGMAAYWDSVPENEVTRRVKLLNDGQDFTFRSDRAKARWEQMDQVERQERIAALIDSASGGRWASRRRGTSVECEHKYASRNEREVCRWFNARGIAHESQVYINGRPADFRCQGVFIEFDGIGREDAYFEKKFGDEPYVVIRDRRELDRDLGFLLEEDLLRAGGVVTFEPVVSITPTREVVMYDVMMEGDPHNFLADGVVVHNTAWLKFHYPVQFLTAVLSTVDKGRIPEFINEARRMGYRVLPPDVNLSGKGFSAGQMEVRYGLDGVKGVGPAAVEAIIKGQPYADWDDFMARKAEANMGIVKTLAKVGAFDTLVPDRKALERRLEWDTDGSADRCFFKDESVLAAHGLPCTFDWSSEPALIGKRGQELKKKPLPKRCSKACRNWTQPVLQIEDTRPYTAEEIMAKEMDLLGVHLSATPFDRIPDDVLDDPDVKRGDEIESGPNGEYVTVGIINKVRPHTAKNGKEMAFIGFYARNADIDVTVFSDDWTKYRRDLKKGNLCLAVLFKNDRGITLSALQPI